MPLAPPVPVDCLQVVSALGLRCSYKVYRRPFRVPVRTSRSVWEARDGIIFRLEREDGRTAFGEIAPLEAFGTETLAGALAWCASVGSQPEADSLRAVPRGLPCCASAVDDAWAQLDPDNHAKVGGRKLAVACLLPTGPAAIDALARGRDGGFTTFKLKIGAADFATERTLIERLAAQLPTDGRLRLDANGGLDARTAQRWLAAAESWPVEFIEQPLATGQSAELSALARDFATPLALDESVRGADDIKRWRDREWRGLFVIKPALAGTRDDLQQEIALAPAAFVFSSALETAIGAGAGLRLAFACGIERALGYGVQSFFPDDGLGGALTRPWVGAQDLAAMPAEDAWNRL